MFSDLEELDTMVAKLQHRSGAVSSILQNCLLPESRVPVAAVAAPASSSARRTTPASSTPFVDMAAVPRKALPSEDVVDVESFADLPSLEDFIGASTTNDPDGTKQRQLMALSRLRPGSFVRGEVVIVNEDGLVFRIRQALRVLHSDATPPVVRVFTFDLDTNVMATVPRAEVGRACGLGGAPTKAGGHVFAAGQGVVAVVRTLDVHGGKVHGSFRRSRLPKFGLCLVERAVGGAGSGAAASVEAVDGILAPGYHPPGGALLWTEAMVGLDLERYAQVRPAKAAALPGALASTRPASDSEDDFMFSSPSATLPERASSRYNRLLERDKAFRNPRSLHTMCEAFGVVDRAGWVFDVGSVGADFLGLEEEQRSNAAAQFVESGVTLAKAGSNGEAVKLYRRALKAKPRYIPAMVAMGAALANQGDFRGAIAQLEEAVAADPTHANAAKYLAATRAKLLRVEELSTAPKALVRTADGGWASVSAGRAPPPPAPPKPPPANGALKSDILETLKALPPSRLEALLKKDAEADDGSGEDRDAGRSGKRKHKSKKDRKRKHKSSKHKSKRGKSKKRKRSRRDGSGSGSSSGSEGETAAVHPILERRRGLWQ